jgi:phage gp29-like protein
MRIPVSRDRQPARGPRRATAAPDPKPVMGAYDGVYAPSFRYAGFSLDAMLAQKGYPFVEEMLTMAACRAPFNLKRYAVLQDGWSIEPAVQDPNAPDHASAAELAKAVELALQNIRDPETDLVTDLRSILFDMMGAAWTGFRVAEIGWQYQEGGPLAGKHGLRGIWVKPCQQIGFDVDKNTLAVQRITSYTPGGGYDFDIPVERCLYYVHGQSANYPAGTGDWRACYKHWLRLDGCLKFWAMALERWGAPVLVLSYPAMSPAEMRAAEQIASTIRQGAAPVLPDNVKFEMLNAPRSVFVAMERSAIWDTQQIALNINSNVLTTSSGTNSLALGKVHMESGFTVYYALSQDIETLFTGQIIRRFVLYNYGEQALKLCPSLRLRKRPEGDQLQTAQMLQILMQGGNLPSRSKLIREQLGLPPLDSDEEKMLDAERIAREEAQSQLADGRLSGSIAPMTDERAQAALDRLTQAIYTRNTSVPTR